MMTKLHKLVIYIGVISILSGCAASADRPSLLSTPTTARPKPLYQTSANMGVYTQQIQAVHQPRW